MGMVDHNIAETLSISSVSDASIAICVYQLILNLDGERYLLDFNVEEMSLMPTLSVLGKETPKTQYQGSLPIKYSFTMLLQGTNTRTAFDAYEEGSTYKVRLFEFGKVWFDDWAALTSKTEASTSSGTSGERMIFQLNLEEAPGNPLLGTIKTIASTSIVTELTHTMSVSVVNEVSVS